MNKNKQTAFSISAGHRLFFEPVDIHINSFLELKGRLSLIAKKNGLQEGLSSEKLCMVTNLTT
jgi:hypothetical protein